MDGSTEHEILMGVDIFTQTMSKLSIAVTNSVVLKRTKWVNFEGN